jgi:hypothetical protein
VQRIEGRGSGCVFAIHASAACAEARFESIDSFHMPSRVKMCEGMCRACEEEGAIFAYARAAGSASSASSG